MPDRALLEALRGDVPPYDLGMPYAASTTTDARGGQANRVRHRVICLLTVHVLPEEATEGASPITVAGRLP